MKRQKIILETTALQHHGTQLELAVIGPKFILNGWIDTVTTVYQKCMLAGEVYWKETVADDLLSS